jgi:hypothetical protein
MTNDVERVVAMHGPVRGVPTQAEPLIVWLEPDVDGRLLAQIISHMTGVTEVVSPAPDTPSNGHQQESDRSVDVTSTPRTDAVCITPIMGEECTPHKWDQLQALARSLERDVQRLSAHIKTFVDGQGVRSFKAQVDYLAGERKRLERELFAARAALPSDTPPVVHGPAAIPSLLEAGKVLAAIAELAAHRATSVQREIHTAALKGIEFLAAAHAALVDVPPKMDEQELPNCNRVEIINHVSGIGREYVGRYIDSKVSLSVQDQGRTLKIFVSPVEQPKVGDQP